MAITLFRIGDEDQEDVVDPGNSGPPKKPPTVSVI